MGALAFMSRFLHFHWPKACIVRLQAIRFLQPFLSLLLWTFNHLPTTECSSTSWAMAGHEPDCQFCNIHSKLSSFVKRGRANVPIHQRTDHSRWRTVVVQRAHDILKLPKYLSVLCSNFEISLAVFIPNTPGNHSISRNIFLVLEDVVWVIFYEEKITLC